MASSTNFEPLVWLDLGSKLDLPDHWQTLYSLGRCVCVFFFVCAYKNCCFIVEVLTGRERERERERESEKEVFKNWDWAFVSSDISFIKKFRQGYILLSKKKKHGLTYAYVFNKHLHCKQDATEHLFLYERQLVLLPCFSSIWLSVLTRLKYQVRPNIHHNCNSKKCYIHAYPRIWAQRETRRLSSCIWTRITNSFLMTINFTLKRSV